MKRREKKLQLNRETIHHLELRSVLGGDYTQGASAQTKCNTCPDSNAGGSAGCVQEV